MTSAPGARRCRHGLTRAQILKAEATGPSVPAINGNADEANHQRLEEVSSEAVKATWRGKANVATR